LTDEAGYEKTKPPLRNVVADGALAIIAGSDTTASALSSLFFLLLSNRDCYDRLQAEIDDLFPPGENAMDTSKYANMPFLSSCINETLRLHPPVPTSGPREVLHGTGGKMIGGRFIPEGTQIYIPPYSLHRNPSYFSPSPEKFLPDRWLNTADFEATHSNAFIPFSYGPANCVGKNLARQQMMMVVSHFLQTFDMRFAEGFDHELWPNTLHDYFITARGSLMVVLTPRAGH